MLLGDACKVKHNQGKYSALESDMTEYNHPGFAKNNNTWVYLHRDRDRKYKTYVNVNGELLKVELNWRIYGSWNMLITTSGSLPEQNVRFMYEEQISSFATRSCR